MTPKEFRQMLENMVTGSMNFSLGNTEDGSFGVPKEVKKKKKKKFGDDINVTTKLKKTKEK